METSNLMNLGDQIIKILKCENDLKNYFLLTKKNQLLFGLKVYKIINSFVIEQTNLKPDDLSILLETIKIISNKEENYELSEIIKNISKTINQ